VDDTSVNAFALPGGFIYVTRGILAHLNSEAELAAVLGHEIGHVTARHGVNQMSKAQLAQLGLGVGMILAPEAAEQFGGLAQTGMSLMFLKFSRDDERQADDLGLRYAARTGYDPRESPHVYDMLDRVSAEGGGGRLPGWMSTHPAPENRRERMEAKIASMGGDFSGTEVDRAGYFDSIDGMTFGDDPREGYFRDERFFHPGMEFRYDFPAGWNLRNQRLAVMGVSPQEDAMIQLTLARADDPNDALRAFFNEEGIRAGRRWRSTIGGFPAASSSFLVDTQQGTLVGLVAYLSHRDVVFQLLGFTTSEQWEQYDETLAGSLASFARLTDRAALDVEPKQIDIVTPRGSISLAAFALSYDATVPVKTLALINQLDTDQYLQAGRPYKSVSGGVLPP
jgi:predicted Zn-dependent protease